VVRGARGVVALPPLTRETVLSQVRSGLAPLAEITMGDALQVAWGACRTLVEAGRESLARNAPQPVHLDGYSVPIDYEPRLDVTVEDVQVATVHFRLRLTIEALRLDGSVEGGRLVSLACEALSVTATVEVEGELLAERKLSLDARVELPLPAEGLPVVPDAVSLRSDHGSVSEPDPPQGDRLG
jgi:hypothetical protein